MNILLDTNVILEYFAVCEKYAIAKQLFEHLRGVRNMQFKDIEDGCQFELAKKASCEMLLTFNDSDYPTDTESGVTVLSPEEYLESCK